MTEPETKLTASVLHRPMFLWSLPFAFLYFAMPVVGKEFGASAVEIGGLFSVFTATTLVLRPVVGWALDRLSAKLFLVIALCIYGAAMAAFAAADSLNWLYAARIIQGVGSACLWTSSYTIIANLTETAARGKALGRLNEITTQGGLVGIFAAFTLMSTLPEGLGWKVIFAGFAILTLLGAVIASRTVPASLPASQRSESATRISSRLIRLLIIVLLMGIPEAMLAPVYLIFLQDKFAANMETLAWAFFPAAAVAAVLSARLGALSDRYGRVPMMALGLVGAGLVTLLMPHLPSLVWLAIFYVITTIMWSISEPAETALVADLTGQERRGLAYGLYDFFENLGFVIGPLLGGLAYEWMGQASPFYIYGAMSVVGAVLVLVLLSERRPAASAVKS
jgi:MFS transporter, DHA1 family, multidrug resistance protein